MAKMPNQMIYYSIAIEKIDVIFASTKRTNNGNWMTQHEFEWIEVNTNDK